MDYGTFPALDFRLTFLWFLDALRHDDYNKKINLGVLISGSGNTLQNFIDQIEQGKLITTIQVAISSKPDVVGLDRARKHGIPTAVVPYSNYKNVDAFQPSHYG